MGSAFYRIKIGLYIFIIILVGILFAVRVHNALQKTNYSTGPIFEKRDAQITLHYPGKILSAKNDATYPLTVSFYYTGDITSPHTYEISLQSPTLIFVDSDGAEIAPRFQFTSDQAFLERSVYVRPYLSDAYPRRHIIHMQVDVDGLASNQPAPVEIEVEAEWASFLSLAATSLLEISVATALITWIINIIDASSTARKERVASIRQALNSLASLPYLEQMDKVRQLEDEVQNEKLNDDVGEEVKRVKNRYKEEDFFRAMGEQLRRDPAIDFVRIRGLHHCFYPTSDYQNCLDALEEASEQSVAQEKVLSLIEIPMRLWDKFDVSVKDFILGFLRRVPDEARLAEMAPGIIWEHVLKSPAANTPDQRRRILRDVGMQRIFPQLVDPSTGKPHPLGYDAEWMHYPNRTDNSKVLDWLRQFTLVLDPFGGMDLKNYPFYPQGFARPDDWTNLVNPFPYHAQCPTEEDAKALAYHLRAECLPMKKVIQGNTVIESGNEVFPVWVSFNQSSSVESPLLTIARSAASTWMRILPFSPDAMLDLPLSEQEALLDLLSWAFGSTNIVTNLLKQAGMKSDSSASLLTQRIEQFQSRFSSTQLPTDSIFLSWLKIRPPDLHCSYLILPLDEIPTAAKVWWLEQFSPLISTLFLNGIITKAFSALHVPVAFPLSATQLGWSMKTLKTSLNSQFEAAMDKAKQREMGQVVDFRFLFGSDPSIGYFEAEEETTDKLIAASNNSLARMLNLGNRLFQHHCENRIKDGVPEKYLYIEDLETILKTT